MLEFLFIASTEYGDHMDTHTVVQRILVMPKVFKEPYDLCLYFNSDARRSSFLRAHGLGNNASQFLKWICDKAQEGADENRIQTLKRAHSKVGLYDVDPNYNLAKRLFGNDYKRESHGLGEFM